MSAMRAAAIASSKPALRLREESISSGPVMCPMQREPRSIRCSVAIRPALRLSRSTYGIDGASGSPTNTTGSHERSSSRPSSGPWWDTMMAPSTWPDSR